jgi:hypothetical protein
MKTAALFWTAAVASLAVTASARATIMLRGDLAADNLSFSDVGAVDSTRGPWAASGDGFDDETSAFPSTVLATGANPPPVEAIRFGGTGLFIGSFSGTAQPLVAPMSREETEIALWGVYDPILQAPKGSGPPGSPATAAKDVTSDRAPSIWRSSSRQPR